MSAPEHTHTHTHVAIFIYLFVFHYSFSVHCSTVRARVFTECHLPLFDLFRRCLHSSNRERQSFIKELSIRKWMASLALTHSLTHGTAYLIGSYFAYVQLVNGISLHLVDVESRTAIFAYIYTHARTAHTIEIAANECMSGQRKMVSLLAYWQQSKRMYEYVLGETKIYSWDTMRILRDQFYGTEKCSSI